MLLLALYLYAVGALLAWLHVTHHGSICLSGLEWFDVFGWPIAVPIGFIRIVFFK